MGLNMISKKSEEKSEKKLLFLPHVFTILSRDLIILNWNMYVYYWTKDVNYRNFICNKFILPN